MVIFEHFNTTNQTQPKAEGHDILIQFVGQDDCSYVEYIDIRLRCDFVTRNPNCRDPFYLEYYMSFMYCIAGTTPLGHGIVLITLMALMCYIFSLASEIANKFFCPGLAALAKLLHMGEALAGVTLIAFGNASFDLYGSWRNMYGDTTGVFASNFGCCIFIVAIIGAIIVYIRPFCVDSTYFVRDFVFLLFATTFVNYVMMDEKVNILESICVILIYFIYIVVIIIDQVQLLNLARDVSKKIESIKTTDDNESRASLEEILRNVNELKSIEIYDKSRSVMDINITKSAEFQGGTPNSNLFKQFIHSLNPISIEAWKLAGWKGKLIQILQAPAIFVLLLVIPVVDYNAPVHGWSKLLNVIQIVVTPLLIALFLGQITTSLLLCTLAFGIPLSVIIFLTSRTDTAPVYQPLYAIISSLASVFITGVLVQHIDSILDTLGIASQTSTAFLAVTISAWGSSLGDLFTNLTLARQGYYKMGFSACIGGPIFLITVAFGVNFVYKCMAAENRVAKVNRGAIGSNIYIFLFSTAWFILIGGLLAKGQIRKSLGIYLICIYALFTIFNVSIEFEHIHAYGTDHHTQRIMIDS
ncbi:mitochondrial sodium/calcium exchanger protein-like isoform X2 [Hermetia illucens]|uniref:mitochondrial sodium/calcium exchanger protein-like isoform X2 n=1 Tax=Hermetia illucens TaxID=343691 RepID=UPI0018CC5236|nr:mitochondrial sodium/calcium exchanger protein-like isoform X2 [Hermetia illucens]